MKLVPAIAALWRRLRHRQAAPDPESIDDWGIDDDWSIDRERRDTLAGIARESDRWP
jgi:hypothetical protein